EWIAIGKVEEPFGLLERLPRLDGNASGDARRVHLALDVGRQEIALQRGHRVVDPLVLPSVISPEMLVRVDYLTGGLRPAGPPYTLTRGDPDSAPFAWLIRRAHSRPTSFGDFAPCAFARVIGRVGSKFGIGVPPALLES